MTKLWLAYRKKSLSFDEALAGVPDTAMSFDEAPAGAPDTAMSFDEAPAGMPYKAQSFNNAKSTELYIFTSKYDK